jgi:hypothetical protein
MNIPVNNTNSTQSKSENQTIDSAKLIQQIKQALATSDKTQKTNPLVKQDIDDRISDRALKRTYAFRFIWILVAQLVVMNFIFIGTGVGWFNFSEWALNLYMTGTLAEVFGVVMVITKNLFSTKK